jgi:hypothetical protein
MRRPDAAGWFWCVAIAATMPCGLAGCGHDADQRAAAAAGLASAYRDAARIRAEYQEQVAAARRRAEQAEHAQSDAVEEQSAVESAQRQRRLDSIRSRERALTVELVSLSNERTSQASGTPTESPRHRQIEDRLVQIRGELEQVRAAAKALANPAGRPAGVPPPHRAAWPSTWEVVRVSDGATLVAVPRHGDWTGEPERVRLLGVGVPAPDRAEAARRFLAGAVLKQTIWIEFETPDEPTRDADGRLLGWVWTAAPGLESTLENAEVIAAGLGERAAQTGPGRYAGLLAAAAVCGRAHRVAGW